MTNVTKRNIHSKEFNNLKAELSSVIASLTQTSATHFFDELFTESEKIMIIKRFGALVMFTRGYSSYKVWNVLQVSPTTAHKWKLQYENGQYNNLLRVCTKANMPALFTFIDKLIKAQGKQRWIFLK